MAEGRKMTKEVWEKITVIVQEYIAKEDELVKKAKKEGTYVCGLDTNKELYKDIKEEYKRKLKIILDEENAKYENGGSE